MITRAICGYMFFLGAPSALNTELALRQGIWAKAGPGWPMWGIPDVFYVDQNCSRTRGSGRSVEHRRVRVHPRAVPRSDVEPEKLSTVPVSSQGAYQKAITGLSAVGCQG